MPVVEELWRVGHDVLTVHETRKAVQAVSDQAISFICKRRIFRLTNLSQGAIFESPNCGSLAQLVGVLAVTPKIASSKED